MTSSKVYKSIFTLFVSILLIRQVVLDDLALPIEDEVVRTTVKEFRELCPYTNLCSVNSSKTFPEDDYMYYGGLGPTPCCEPCSCFECGTSCCPDKLDTYLSDTEVNSVKQDPPPCLWLQYKPAIENSIYRSPSYYAVSFCPPGYPDEYIHMRCLRDYKDFKFEEDFSHLVPVSNNDTIFKNKYCAICNGEDLSSLHYWDTKITCEISTTLPAVNSYKELKSALDNREFCALFFDPGNLTYPGSSCDFLIDRCNVTGLSQSYHQDTERACLSYTSVYKTLYRNVHCYLCNKEPEAEVEEFCEADDYTHMPNTFVGLLDFQGLAGTFASTEVKQEPCPKDHVYDAMQNICRLITCPDFMIIAEGKCKPLFLSVYESASTVYDVIITVEPRENEDSLLLPGSIESMFESILYRVSNLLEKDQSNFSICQLYGVVFLKNSISELTADFVRSRRHHLKLSEIQYFAFRLQLRGRNNADFKEELEILEGMFQKFSQGHFLLPYIVRYRKVPLEVFAKALIAHFDYEFIEDPAHMSALFNLVTYEVIRDALVASFQYGADNITMAPLHRDSFETCYTVATYHVQMFCPKVQLFPDEFNLTEDGIVINDVNLFLSNHEVEFSLNNSVFVCYSTYLSGITQNKDDSETESLITLTLISLSLSLISLCITFMIYSLLDELRTLPGLNIMGLVSSLFVSHLLTLLNGVVKIGISELCVAFGIVLHFALLLSIFWMFVCTFHMGKVFIKLEKMNPKSRSKYQSLMRYLCFTIAMSVLFVVINISVSAARSSSSSIGYDDVTCYLDSSDMLLVTVALPIGLVVIVNMAIFICVIIKVGRISSMKTNSTKERNNILIFIKLSTITGITWGLGFLYQFTTIEAFAYAFVVLNASQGVYIMVSFVMNKRVADMLKSRYSSRFESKSTGKSTIQSPITANKAGGGSSEPKDLSKM